MAKLIENLAVCEIRSVIRFLKAFNIKPKQLLWGVWTKCNSMVSRWVRQFNDDRENVHDDERMRRPSFWLVMNWFLRLMKKFKETLTSQFLFTLWNFLKFQELLFHEIVYEELGFRKLCACWIPKILIEEHKKSSLVVHLSFWHGTTMTVTTSLAV